MSLWFTEVDANYAENIELPYKYLTLLLKKLTSETANKIFPNIMLTAGEEIFKHMKSNNDLAEKFLDNLDLYYN